jgi:hypothetical protein
VAQDEPHVSVGGLLEKVSFGNHARADHIPFWKRSDLRDILEKE